MDPITYIKEHAYADYWPPHPIYGQLVVLAINKLQIPENEIRKRYWTASVKEWCRILQVN